MLIPTFAHAQVTLAVEDFRITGDNPVINDRRADSFAWPQIDNLDAVVTLNVGGVTGGAKAQTLIVITDDSGTVLGKRKDAHTLSSGRQELRLDDVFSTTGVIGRRMLKAQLEVALKGAAVERRELSFSITGPPPPKVEIAQVRLYVPLPDGGDGSPPQLNAQQKNRQQFAVGATFAVEALVRVSDNPAKLEPNLIVFAAMDEDAKDIAPDAQDQPYIDHWDVRKLEAADHTWRVTATGRLPYFFLNPWQHSHPFHVYVIADFGSGVRTSAYAQAEVFDYYPGENRRNQELDQRLILIHRAPTWRLANADQPDTGITP